MHTDNSYYFHQGWQDYYEGVGYTENPYKYPSGEWCDWYEGWDAAYMQEEGQD